MRHGTQAHVDVLPVDHPLGGQEQLTLANNFFRLSDELKCAIERGTAEAPDLLARAQIEVVGAGVSDATDAPCVARPPA